MLLEIKDQNKNTPYTDQFIDLIISKCFLINMDQIVEMYSQGYVTFRDKIKEQKFNDQKILMLF